MVQGEEERMVAAGELDQPPARQGTALQIEWLEALLDNEPLERGFGVALALEIVLLEGKARSAAAMR